MKAPWPLLVIIAALAGCASFRPTPVEEVPFKSRARSQTERNVTVTAVVLGAEETEAVFGAPLYERGIQPLWLEITNHDEEPVWYLHVGTDRYYFPPYEVAYMHRSGLSAEAVVAMERFYHDCAIGKHVPPGATRSGFLFTNLELGTKDFNVDLIGEDKQVRTFTFFCNVPGFRVDHEDVDWENIYGADEIVDHDEDGLRRALRDLPGCTTNAAGTGEGDPLNIIVIGSSDDVYHALIRTGWDETGSLDASSRLSLEYAPARPVSIGPSALCLRSPSGRRHAQEPGGHPGTQRDSPVAHPAHARRAGGLDRPDRTVDRPGLRGGHGLQDRCRRGWHQRVPAAGSLVRTEAAQVRLRLGRGPQLARTAATQPGRPRVLHGWPAGRALDLRHDGGLRGCRVRRVGRARRRWRGDQCGGRRAQPG